MSKLIDLEFAINECKKPSIYDLCDTYDFLKELPTIDPVHYTGSCYCKECWYYTEWGECKEFGNIMKPNEFCSRGVPKNGKTY